MCICIILLLDREILGHDTRHQHVGNQEFGNHEPKAFSYLLKLKESTSTHHSHLQDSRRDATSHNQPLTLLSEKRKEAYSSNSPSSISSAAPATASSFFTFFAGDSSASSSAAAAAAFLADPRFLGVAFAFGVFGAAGIEIVRK